MTQSASTSCRRSYGHSSYRNILGVVQSVRSLKWLHFCLFFKQAAIFSLAFCGWVYSLIISLGFQYTSLTMPWSSDALLRFIDLNPTKKNAKKEPHPNSDSGSEDCQLSEVVQITGRRRVHYLHCLTTNPHVTEAAPAAHQGGSPQFSSFLQLH